MVTSICPVKETPKINKLEKFNIEIKKNKAKIRGKNLNARGEDICCLKISSTIQYSFSNKTWETLRTSVGLYNLKKINNKKNRVLKR
jgi:hypothetical protein